MAMAPRLLGLLSRGAGLWLASQAGALHVGAAQDGGTTPVAKVITLLDGLSTQIEEEGKSEAVEYDKFACFCKAEVVDKDRSIEKSKEEIGALAASIKSLDADITDLNGEVTKLGTRIGEIEKEISTEEAARSKDRAAYEAKDKEISEAIAAVDAAIDALRDSKADMDGSVDLDGNAKASLAQAAARVRGAPSAGAAAARAAALLEGSVSGASGQPAYKYRSNDIIGVLQNLLVDFKATKERLFEDEHLLKTASEKKVQGLVNEKKFKTQDKDEKEAIAAAKTEDKEDTENEKTAEEKAQKSDEEFLKELTTQCETKAKEWDQRSKHRAQELTAISEAAEILKTTVSSAYSANKKLVGLIGASAVNEKLPAALPVSLLQEVQRRGTGAGRSDAGAAATQRALDRVERAASALGSPALAALALKLEVHKDHFVKVRGLIADIIAKLEAQAAAEATSKGNCDTQMGKAIKSRDDQKLKMEEQQGIIAKKEAEGAQLKQDIAQLSQEMASLSKALNEATQLRAEEKALNAKTVADATSGKAAVEKAIKVLKAFYGGAGAGSFVQKYTPPGADREGATVGDRAPEVSWSGDYKGKTGASKGIMGLLEVVLADFDRTISTGGKTEAEAEKLFKELEGKTKKDIKAKKTEKGTKEAEITKVEGDVVTAKDELQTAGKLHKSALDELQDLEAMCVAGEETFAERKAAREKEIEALKEALNILEDYQS